eukprot:1157764-Pelagomonas_calceolata.AAC.8
MHAYNNRNTFVTTLHFAHLRLGEAQHELQIPKNSTQVAISLHLDFRSGQKLEVAALQPEDL